MGRSPRAAEGGGTAQGETQENKSQPGKTPGDQPGRGRDAEETANGTTLREDQTDGRHCAGIREPGEGHLQTGEEECYQEVRGTDNLRGQPQKYGGTAGGRAQGTQETDVSSRAEEQTGRIQGEGEVRPDEHRTAVGEGFPQAAGDMEREAG